MSNQPLLHCNNLCKSYLQGAVTTQALRSVSLSLQSAKQVVLVGRSGSGKSTLLHLLGGLDSPTSGEIFFQDHAMHLLSAAARARVRNQQLGFIYQFHHLLPDFSALENVAMPLLIGGVAAAGARQRAAEMLGSVGLQERLHHRPSALSGGERQRVAIARALVHHPALVLADEPTGALDRENTSAVVSLIAELTRSYGTAFLVATHDLQLAAEFPRCIEMCDGAIVSTASESEAD